MSATATPMAPGAVLPQAPAASTNGANGKAPAPVDPKAAAPAPVEKPFQYKTKIRSGDGREVEVEYDKPKLDRTLVEHRDAVAKLARYEKELAERRAFDKMLRENPREALSKHGLNLDELALQRAQREAQLAELSPEQRRIVELEQQIQEREESTKRTEQERQQTQAQRRKQAYQEKTRAEVIQSLKHVGLDIMTGPQNAQVRGTMLAMAAKIQARTIRAGKPAYTPQELGAEVQKAWLSDATRISGLVASMPEFRAKNAEALRGHLDSLTSGLEGVDLLTFLGPTFARRIVQAQLAQLAGGKSSQPAPTNGQQPTQQQGGDVPLDYYEMRRRMNQGLK